ncbi:hypothetical protein GCM10017562_01050 [Streptomyces roseofulvus]|uniref:hypothetical protein n=1 Tax=Streptomyces roseofulvus TaxID=33902 RepID=UPI0031F8CD19
MTAPEDDQAVQHRMHGHATRGISARAQLLGVLAATGIGDDQADSLLAAVEAGAIAGTYSWVVEEADAAPGGRGEEYERGWADAVSAVSTVLASMADARQHQRGHAASVRGLAQYRAEDPPSVPKEREGEERWPVSAVTG